METAPTINVRQIDKREFVRQFSKYLKIPGVYVLTGREGNQTVEIYGNNQCTGALDNIVECQTNSYNTLESRFEEAVLKPYGCGCKREEGNPLCGKHGRF